MNSRATSLPRKKPYLNLPTSNWWDRRAAERAAKRAANEPTCAAPDYGQLIGALCNAFEGFTVPCDTYPGYTDDWSRYMRRASAAGFRLLGSGYFSAAFVHLAHPHVAFKLGFKKEDSGAAYAAWCRQNQGRPGVPEIYAVERHAIGYVVVMKKYQPLRKARDYGKSERVHHELRAVIEDGKQSGERGGGIWEPGLLVGKHITEAQYEVARDIRKFFDGVAQFDLHSENVMYDPDLGQLIITDPVSFKRGTRTPTVSAVVREEVRAIAPRKRSELPAWQCEAIGEMQAALMKNAGNALLEQFVMRHPGLVGIIHAA